MRGWRSIRGFAAALFTVALAACASRGYTVTEGMPDVERAVLKAQALRLTDANEMEKRIARESLYGFFFYLNARHGNDRLERFVDAWNNSGDFGDSLRGTYGKTIYQLGYEMYKDFDSPAPEADAEMKTTDVDDFRLHYPKGSKAEQDIDMIVYLLRNYSGELDALYLRNTVSRGLYESSVKALGGGAVHIFLFQSEAQAKRHFPGLDATATTIFTFRRQNGGYRPHIGIVFKYYNILTASVFAHELTHVVLTLAHTGRPLEFVPEGPGAGAAMQAQVNGWGMAGDAVGEGIAEYTNEKVGIFYKLGVMKAVDHELRYMDCRGVPWIPLKVLMTEKDPARFHLRVQYYQQAHSLVRHIAQKYGAEKLMALYLSPRGESDFARVLRVSFRDFEREWRGALVCGTAGKVEAHSSQ